MEFEPKIIPECIQAASYSLIKDRGFVERAAIETPLLKDAIEAALNIRMNYMEGVLDAISLMTSKPGEKIPDRIANLIENYKRATIELLSKETTDLSSQRGRMSI